MISTISNHYAKLYLATTEDTCSCNFLHYTKSSRATCLVPSNGNVPYIHLLNFLSLDPSSLSDLIPTRTTWVFVQRTCLSSWIQMLSFSLHKQEWWFTPMSGLPEPSQNNKERSLSSTLLYRTRIFVDINISKILQRIVDFFAAFPYFCEFQVFSKGKNSFDV
jgi:hypothetical protein